MSDGITVKYLTRDKLLEWLVQQGYPFTKSTLDKLCAPSRGEGPPVVAVMPSCAGRGRGRLLYDPELSIRWAENLVRRQRPAA
jgi:hypothetical protein